MITQFKNVIFVVPHLDDEIWSIGTLKSILLSGAKITYLALCSEPSKEQQIAGNALYDEADRSLGCIGINYRIFKSFPGMHFESCSQEIRQYLYDIRQSKNPDLIFIPSSYDYHQDHIVVHNTAIQAFNGSRTTVLGYQTAYTRLPVKNCLFVPISGECMATKLSAAQMYKCQQYRHYIDPGVITSKSRNDGINIGCEFAEIFEIIKMVVK